MGHWQMILIIQAPSFHALQAKKWSFKNGATNCLCVFLVWVDGDRRNRWRLVGKNQHKEALSKVYVLLWGAYGTDPNYSCLRVRSGYVGCTLQNPQNMG